MKNILRISIASICIFSFLYSQPPIPIDDFLDYSQQIQSYREALSLSQLLSTAITSFKETIATLPATISSWFTWESSPTEPVTVRFSKEDCLCLEEKDYLANRKEIVQQAVQQLLPHFNRTIHKTPTIAICCSGGGFRAMISTLGFLQGLQETGILDCVTYISTLSGSTWLVAPWLLSQQSLHDYQKIVSNAIHHGIKPLNAHYQLQFLAQHMVNRIIQHNSLSAIDLYGALLANTLMDFIPDKKLSLTFKQAHQYLNPKLHPFPIYTTICGNTYPYEWFEITPFELGSSYLKSYIPTWTYGHLFNQGNAIKSSPELTLAHFLGMWGSAFSLSLNDLLHHTADDLIQVVPSPLKKALALCLSITLGNWRENRLLPSLLPNFTYQMTSSPLKDIAHLMLIDAGIDFNLPFPPLLRASRAVDLILVYDASASEGYTQLQKAANYAHRYNIPFPSVGNQSSQQLITIFQDNHIKAPSIIYIPCKQNNNYSQSFNPQDAMAFGYCNTLNFRYNPAQIEELCGLARFTIHQHADTIKALIRSLTIEM